MSIPQTPQASAPDATTLSVGYQLLPRGRRFFTQAVKRLAFPFRGDGGDVYAVALAVVSKHEWALPQNVNIIWVLDQNGHNVLVDYEYPRGD